MAKKVLKILKEIVRKGHVPCRYMQGYSPYHAILVNCFEHACFNLSEKEIPMIDDFNSNARPLAFLTSSNALKTCANYFNFVVETGLDVAKQEKPVLKNNQWVVTLYFAEDMSDFHFLLKEKDGIWTAKRGFTSTVDTFEEDVDIIHIEKNPPYFKETSYVLTNKFAEK